MFQVDFNLRGERKKKKTKEEIDGTLPLMVRLQLSYDSGCD